MQYSFVLKDNNQRAYYLFTWFLFFLQVAAAAFILNNDNNSVKAGIYLLLGFYALIGMAFYLLKKKRNALETVSLLLAVFYVHFWFRYVGIIAAIACAALYLIVTAVKGKRTSVLFTKEGVHLTRVFKTAVFPWAALDNVILKDNLLTIDFKTNRIIQVEIVEEEKQVDETAFNQFCAQELKTSATAN